MNITLGQYVPGNSILHKIDPRVKFILLIILILVLFFFDIYIAFIGYTLFASMLIYISKVPFKSVLKSLKPLYWILLITLLTNPFFHEGTVVFYCSFFSISKEGIIIGITMTYRLILLIVLSSFLTLTTKTVEMTDAVESLLSPLKFLNVNPHIIAMIISLGLRFVPTTIREFNQITKAQKSRGVDFESGNLINKVKNFIPIIFPLILLTFKRADELSMAMEARCYTENKARTVRKKLQITFIDYKAMFFTLIFICCLIFLENIM